MKNNEKQWNANDKTMKQHMKTMNNQWTTMWNQWKETAAERRGLPIFLFFLLFFLVVVAVVVEMVNHVFSLLSSNMKLQAACFSSLGDLQTWEIDHMYSFSWRIQILRLKFLLKASDGEKKIKTCCCFFSLCLTAPSTWMLFKGLTASSTWMPYSFVDLKDLRTLQGPYKDLIRTLERP